MVQDSLRRIANLGFTRGVAVGPGGGKPCGGDSPNVDLSCFGGEGLPVYLLRIPKVEPKSCDMLDVAKGNHPSMGYGENLARRSGGFVKEGS